MAKRKASVIAEEMEVLRAELIELDEVEDPTDEQVARSREALELFEALNTEHKDAESYEKRLEAVRSASLAPVTEPGDGAKPFNVPEVIRKKDAFEDLEMVRSGRLSDVDVVSRAQFAIEGAPRHMDDNARERAMELVERDGRQAPLIARHMLLTGSPEYHEQFAQYIQSRGTYVGEAMRAAMSLTDANGGYLVPFTLDPTIILTNAGIADPIRMISTVKTIATDTWNGVTSAGVTAEWTAEGTEAADASPTFAQPSITPKKADVWVAGSYEVLADAGFASELGRLLADAKTRHEGAAFATANTGATRPRGVVAAVAAVTASIVTSATTNAYVVGDTYNTADALRPRDAAQASWIANKKIFSLTRRFDTAGGSAFWANLGMAVPPQLLGQPAYECSSMASAVTTGGNVLLVGNFSEYYIVDRVGMSVLYEPMVKGSNGRPTGQAGWYAFWRVGADVVDADAFRLLQLNQVAAATALG